MLFSRALQQVRHEGDIDDGQTQRFNSWQSLLVSEGRNFPPQFIKRLIQAEHPLSLPHVSRLSLDHRDDPPAFGLTVSVPPAAVVPSRAHHQVPGAQIFGARLVVQVSGWRVGQPCVVAEAGCGLTHLLPWSQRALLRKIYQVYAVDKTYQGGVDGSALELHPLPSNGVSWRICHFDASAIRSLDSAQGG